MSSLAAAKDPLFTAGIPTTTGTSLEAVEVASAAKEKIPEKSLTLACCFSENEKDCKDFTYDYQFEGFSNHGKASIPEKVICNLAESKDDEKPVYQD